MNSTLLSMPPVAEEIELPGRDESTPQKPAMYLAEQSRPPRGPSAPANIFTNRIESEIESLFVSQDLVMLPRLTKTAPAAASQLSNPSSEIDPPFPSLSWPIQKQNGRMADLLKLLALQSNEGSRVKQGDSGREGDDYDLAQKTQRSLFDHNIAELYKLIGKLLLPKKKLNIMLNINFLSYRWIIENAKKTLADHGLDDDRSSTLSTDSLHVKRVAQHHLSLHPNSSQQGTSHSQDPNKKTITKGRKSIRAISEDLNRRIRVLKGDPAEWNALEAKIRNFL
jgi:hypothetical protein